MQTNDPAIAEAIVVHAETLCDREDHLWDVINKLSIPTDLLTDHRDQNKVDFNTEEMVRAHLYMRIRGFSQSTLAKRLSNHSSLVKSFGFEINNFEHAPSQQDISYAWCNFSQDTQQIIEAAATGIRQEAVEKDVIAESLVPSPAVKGTEDDEDAKKSRREYKRDKTLKTIKLAQKHVLPEFDTGRADNRQYDDIELFNQVARICANNGSAHSEGEVGYLLDDDLTCDGGTLLRALKLLATPDDSSMQLTIDSVLDDDRMPKIDKIRDSVMECFDAATNNILNSIRGDDPFDDRETVAAIDITDDEFTVSPWENRSEGIPKKDYPRMVNGYVDDDPRKQGYKYATVSLVGDCAPIALGVEPYKQNSKWEEDDAPSYPKSELVAQLLDRAGKQADLDRVLLDRGFYVNDVYAEIVDRGLEYTTPVPKYTDDYGNIENIKEHPDADMAIEPNVEFYMNGEVHHTANFLYVPVNDDNDDADGNYAVFVTNQDVETAEDIKRVVNEYRRRWDIENQYKSILDYLPRTSSKDYRVRFTNFILATLIYNLWRLTDYLVKTAFNIDIRDPPVITGKTFATVLGQFLLRLG